MRDFSAKYRGVAHFGLWAEESGDRFGDRDAWNILVEACRRCSCEDVREDEDVNAALEWFASGFPSYVKDFRKALDVADPAQRFYRAGDALRVLRAKLTR